MKLLYENWRKHLKEASQSDAVARIREELHGEKNPERDLRIFRIWNDELENDEQIKDYMLAHGWGLQGANFPVGSTAGDFSNMDLSGIDFSEANLFAAVFNGANLEGCRFDSHRADFNHVMAINLPHCPDSLPSGWACRDGSRGKILAGPRANFDSLDVSGTDFSGIDLGRANFSNGSVAGANFEDTNLRGALFMVTNCEGARFSSADMRFVKFDAANLKSADFQAANLQGTEFNHAKMEGANVSGANLQDADFQGVDLSSFNFTEGARFATAVTDLTGREMWDLVRSR